MQKCNHRGNGETSLWPNSLQGPQVQWLQNVCDPCKALDAKYTGWPFCRRTALRPLLHASVRSTSGWHGSLYLSVGAADMSFFKAFSASSCSGPHVNGVSLHMSCCSGFESSAVLAEYLARYWHIPKNVWSSATFGGTGMPWMALIFSADGLWPLVVYVSLKKETSVALYWILSMLIFKAFSYVVCRNFVSASSWSEPSSFLPQMIRSSAMPMTFGGGCRWYPVSSEMHHQIHWYQMTGGWSSTNQTGC